MPVSALTDLTTVGPVVARPVDLLRLVVVPAFAWAAWQDVQTRRVPNRLWPPLILLGVSLLVLDLVHYYGVGGRHWQLFVLGTVISVGLVVPLVYVFWLLGGFGGADVKGLATLAIVLPAFPDYTVAGVSFPVVEPAVNAFAFTVLTNAVVLGMGYPLALATRNLVVGDTDWGMFVGRTHRWEELPRVHGRILESPEGFTRNGLDVDALRMYLRWRGIELADLRERTEELRDPASLPDEPNPPTDGAVATDGGERTERGDRTAEEEPTDVGGARADDDAAFEDPWGAEAFLEDVHGSAYGTDAETLRGGLEVVATRDQIWVSPGIPFIVPVFVGLVVALAYGDLLYAGMEAVGMV